MQEFLQVVSALNDETRVLFLAFIKRNGRVCVCDVENSFGMIQSRVSRHLKILKDAGFLVVERQGRWAYFQLGELDPFREEMVKKIASLEMELPKLVHGCKV